MRYCQHCILPDTRPNLILNEKMICNACNSHRSKQDIDWDWRENKFRNVVNAAKKKSSGYDCLIPVSGGKDSHWQVIKCKEYGLNPLAVTWKTPGRTTIGQKNLDNLIGLGVDHMDCSINHFVEKKFMLESFKRFGATAIPMHMAIFNIPLTIAVKFKIPLVVWGENSAFEYGSQSEEDTGFRLDSRWLNRYGVTNGTTAKDWISESLSRRELTPYYGPTDSEMEFAGVNAVFLGYYFKWDPETSLAAAMENGFRSREKGPKTGYYDYADIDDEFISVHHWMKWYKFGFTRLFDNLSIEIRNRRLSRQNALEILKREGKKTPHGDIDRFCEFVDITQKRFFHIAEMFRNTMIWKKKNNRWIIEDFLIPDWSW